MGWTAILLRERFSQCEYASTHCGRPKTHCGNQPAHCANGYPNARGVRNNVCSTKCIVRAIHPIVPGILRLKKLSGVCASPAVR